MKKNYPIILGNNFLTVVADKSYSLTSQDARFPKAVDFVKAKNWGAFFLLMDKPAAIARYTKGAIQVFENEILYNGQKVHGVIVERILKFMNDGFDFAPLVAFLDNLYKNVDEDIRNKLYLFLEHNQLAITEKGSFLAFKLVREDGTPIYNSTGTFLNENGKSVRAYEVGKKFFFPKDRIRKTNGECSTEGLYVGNKNYWNGAFDAENNYTGNGKMLIVEIFPQHVCNVPHADATKIVVCELNVIDEYKTIREKANKSVYGEQNDERAVALDGDLPEAYSVGNLYKELVNTKKANQPKRDANGRFLKKAKVVLVRGAGGRFVKKAVNKVKNRGPKRDNKGRFLA